jgi:tetratricopeptide (TPR) repeat protein
LAQIFQSQDKPELSTQVYKDLEKIFPRQPYIKSCLGTVYRELGQFDDAITYFKEALRLDRTMLIARILLTKTLLESGNEKRKGEAIKILYDGLTVHKYQDGVSEIYLMLADILEDSRKYSEACDVLKQLVAFQQKNGRAKIMLGKLYLKRKDAKSALKYLNQARDLQPYDSETLFYLGKALMNLNKNDEAESALEKSVVLNPSFGHGEANRLLGKLHLKRGNLAAAIEKFEKFVEYRASDPEGHVRIANIAMQLGDETKANSSLITALDLWESKFYQTGSKFFKSHTDDLNALRNLSQKCVSGTLTSSTICARISLLLNDVDAPQSK